MRYTLTVSFSAEPDASNGFVERMVIRALTRVVSDVDAEVVSRDREDGDEGEEDGE